MRSNGVATREVRAAARVAAGIPTGDRRPAGEGWTPKGETLRRAARGVMPAHAARVGERLRQRDAARKGHGGGLPRVTPEDRGARYLIYGAFRNYVEQGVIEVRGDWIRLVRNPPRRPRHHWHEALLQFLAQAHPTLDGTWRPKKRKRRNKSLRSVWQDALGRDLRPWEHPHRRPGHAGTWDPEHLLLLDFAGNTIMTLADVSRLGNRRLTTWPSSQMMAGPPGPVSGDSRQAAQA